MWRVGVSLVIAVAVGCGGEPGAKPAAGPGVTADDALAFVHASGSESAARVRWARVLQANALRGLEVLVTGPESAVLFGPDAVDDLLGTLAGLDFEREAAAVRADHVATWTARTGCAARPAGSAPLAGLPGDVVARMPPVLKAAVEELRAGAAFEVTCGAEVARVVLDASGAVIGFEPPQDPAVDAAVVRRFEGLLDE